MQSSPASCPFLSLRSKYSPQHPVLKHAWDGVSHPYKTRGKIMVLYILIFMFSEIRRKDKTFWTEW
jgi:hypothetical protein